MKNERYHLLDMLRGICIILVVLYHVLYNLSEIFGGKYAFFRSEEMEYFRLSFVGVLVILAGISCNFSRSNAKRGAITLLWGMVITIVTAVILPSELILFGVLHFFGCSMLLYAVLAKPFEKIPIVLGTVVSLAVYLLMQNVYANSPELPRSFLLYILGFRTGYHSADYYPMIPWFFLFLTGASLGRLFKERRVPKVFKANPIPALSYIGKHTLFIYLIHQPLAYGGMWLCFNYIR